MPVPVPEPIEDPELHQMPRRSRQQDRARAMAKAQSPPGKGKKRSSDTVAKDMKKGTGKKVKFSTDTVEDKTPRTDPGGAIKDSVLRELIGSGYVKVVRRAPTKRN